MCSEPQHHVDYENEKKMKDKKAADEYWKTERELQCEALLISDILFCFFPIEPQTTYRSILFQSSDDEHGVGTLSHTHTLKYACVRALIRTLSSYIKLDTLFRVDLTAVNHVSHSDDDVIHSYSRHTYFNFPAFADTAPSVSLPHTTTHTHGTWTYSF